MSRMLRQCPYMPRVVPEPEHDMTPKIATCCYCGTRAALVLTGRDRHELACSSCGAPLHDLKMLKAAHPGRSGLVKPSPVRKPSKH